MHIPPFWHRFVWVCGHLFPSHGRTPCEYAFIPMALKFELANVMNLLWNASADMKSKYNRKFSSRSPSHSLSRLNNCRFSPAHAQFQGRTIYFTNIPKNVFTIYNYNWAGKEAIFESIIALLSPSFAIYQNLFVRFACTNRGLLIITITESSGRLQHQHQQQQSQHQRQSKQQ